MDRLAFVQYCSDKKKQIVPLTDIKTQNIENWKPNKKYKIKRGQSYEDGTIIFMDDSADKLHAKIQKSRYRVVPQKHLVSASDTSDHETSKPTKSRKIEKNNELLQKITKRINSSQNTQDLQVIATSNKSVNETEIRPCSDIRVFNKPAIQERLVNDTQIQQCSDFSSIGSINEPVITEPQNIIEAQILKNKVSSLEDELFNIKIQLVKKEKAFEQVIQEKEEISQLLEKKSNESDELRQFNLQYQRRFFNEINGQGNSLRTDENNATVNDVGKIRGSDADLEINMGEGLWLSLQTYALVKARASTPGMFVAALAIALFTEEVLINSSVSGHGSNRKKEGKTKRSILDGRKICAIKGMLKYWLIKDKKCSKYEADEIADNTRTFISKKIARLRKDRYNMLSDEQNSIDNVEETSEDII